MRHGSLIRYSNFIRLGNFMRCRILATGWVTMLLFIASRTIAAEPSNELTFEHAFVRS